MYTDSAKMPRTDGRKNKKMSEAELSQDVNRRCSGPFLVNINLHGKEPVISGSVDDFYTPTTIFHDVTQFGANNWLNGYTHSACLQHTSTRKKNGFHVRRYLPRASEPNLANAYYLEKRLLKASSFEEFVYDLELRERQVQQQSSDLSVNQLKPFLQTKYPRTIDYRVLHKNEIRRMSEGVLNPAFNFEDVDIEDTEQENGELEFQVTRFGGREYEGEESLEDGITRMYSLKGKEVLGRLSNSDNKEKRDVQVTGNGGKMYDNNGNLENGHTCIVSDNDDNEIEVAILDISSNSDNKIEKDDQATDSGGEVYDREDGLKNGNTINMSTDDDNEINETVLDILSESEFVEEADYRRNNSEQRKFNARDDVRISIPEPDDFNSEKVSGIVNTSYSQTTREPTTTPDGTESLSHSNLRQLKDNIGTSYNDQENTEEKSHEGDEPDAQITRHGIDVSNSRDNLDKRTTYTLSSKDDDDVKERVLDIVLTSKKELEEEKNVQNLDDVTLGQSVTEDVKITISDEVDTKKEMSMAPTQTVDQSVQSNGTSPKDSSQKHPNKLEKSISRSHMKVESPPPLDASDEDTKWLAWIEVKFKDIAGEDGEIDLEEFKRALGVKKSFFAERFFELFDQDGSGAIELGELMDGLRMLTKGTPAQKLQFLFDVYDADASGSIDRDELVAVLRACMEESSLSLTEDNLEDLTDVLFDAADEDESGAITFEELKTELEKHPGVIENLTISAAQWLKPPENGNGKKSRLRYFTADYWRNNYRKVGYFLIYWALNIILYAVAMWQYRESNTWIMFARGAGLCLNFNCMWVLVLMLRKSLTFLRMTQLVRILPLDQHILFHKMTAWAIVGFGLVHTMAHIGNSAYAANANAIEMWEVLFTVKAGVGYVGGSAFITGWLLDIILTVMVICSLPFVRRGGHFQVFYWTHILYVPFWILVILHGPHFWKWFIVPGVLFIMEKISRSKFIKMARFGDTYIEEVNLLPSGVTHLVITRPTNFRYKPGDYICIQIPEIATYEWHPFTISSAPEMEGYIWLHVRSAGHWTNKLYKHFDQLEAHADLDEAEELEASYRRRASRMFENFERAYSRRSTIFSKQTRASKRGQKPKQKHKVVKVKCYVDGPYGTGTREVFDTDHAVLVGAGIGVTPMASILQSVWYRFNAVRQTCPNCEHVWYPEEDTCDMKLKKVDFIWINRDQKSFEWFLTLLNQIELEQSSHHGILENCIQMHMYMTAAQKKTDMKGIGLQIALDLMYDKSQRDLITGLRTKTEAGRPDWDKLFEAIRAEDNGKVKIFFCGAPALGKTVKEMAAKFNFAFSKENF